MHLSSDNLSRCPRQQRRCVEVITPRIDLKPDLALQYAYFFSLILPQNVHYNSKNKAFFANQPVSVLVLRLLHACRSQKELLFFVRKSMFEELTLG